MKERDMGGCEFPQSLSSEGPYGGSTLWDKYAAAALTGLLANPVHSATRSAELSSVAAIVADAMIDERNDRMEKPK